VTSSEPLSWPALATVWDMPVAVLVLILAAAGLYLAGARRAPGWDGRDATFFFLGLAVTAIAAGGSVNAYSGVLFSMHMAQHLLLIMVAPTLLLLGRPLELLRRATGGRAHRALARVANARPFAMLTHPALAFLYYTVVVVGTHLTPFQQSALTQPMVHAVEELLYLSSGCLLLLPILGVEPVRRRLPHLMRLVLLLAGMVVDTIVGLTLLMTATLPFPAYARTGRIWGPSPIEDLHWGGAMMWVGGDLLMAALAVVVITHWVNAPSGGNDLGPWLEAARRSALTRNEERSFDGDIDDDAEALQAYNAMLARLAEQGQRPDRKGQAER
jgi:cytochrome c oxidase assembly factor CtaG